ncbi:MAG: DNA ligase [Wolbachia endosymbiont of Ctenocephalides orientis wCori]|nr:MAG: DNA ligase [Wolbachia endosymbiont of Ctenocephalides orientis wCori]
MYSLGIRFVGEHVAKLLANRYVSFENLMAKLSNNQAFSDLLCIEGIGEKIAESIRAFFSDQQNINMLNNLVSHLKIFLVANNRNSSSLSGKIVVFTGTLSISRKEAQEQAEALGAKVSSSVSTNSPMSRLSRIQIRNRNAIHQN